MSAQSRRHEITDTEWERIKEYFPARDKHTMGRPSKDAQMMLNGILWILGFGASWRGLPERYGPWQTVYKDFGNGKAKRYSGRLLKI